MTLDLMVGMIHAIINVLSEINDLVNSMTWSSSMYNAIMFLFVKMRMSSRYIHTKPSAMRLWKISFIIV